MCQFAKRGVPVIYLIENNQYGMTGQVHGEVTGIDYLARRGVAYAEDGMHAEVVTLLIPGLNDGEDEVRDLSRWLVKNAGPDVPLHFSRFQPMYKMTNLSRTPAQTVIRARDLAIRNYGGRFAQTVLEFDAQGNLTSEVADI